VKKALFLDRDGVVNVEKNYVYRIEDFEFIDGIFTLVQTAQKMGYLPFIVTNQAGIGRGLYTESDYRLLTRWIVSEFAMQGVHITGVYHCPYHEIAGIGEYRKPSFDRKPNPGMLLRARDEWQVNLAQSILIGDKLSDIAAGRNAGVGTLVLYADHSFQSGEESGFPEIVRCASLQDITNTLFN